MKILLVFLLLPLVSVSQTTVHIDDDEVKYEDSVSVQGLTSAEIIQRAKRILPQIVENYKEAAGNSNASYLEFTGEITLNTPFTHIRKAHYTLKLDAANGLYNYEVDKVFVVEKRRGSTNQTRTSKEIIKSIEEGGEAMVEAEKLLNELDLRIQMVLTILKNRIQPALNAKR
ncbi:MAG TPA: hypothetical protein VM368_09325 [Flavisolibacter sp.]|nr:hypothetical protein [Flavisolibacter sp.]